MSALRRLTTKARHFNQVNNECFAKKQNVRMEMVKRNLIGETYEGTGKTTGYILNKRGIDVICIDYISSQGFTLSNGWGIIGSAIFFPHTLFCWRVDNLQDIKEETLALFSLLQPKVECLLIGYGYKEEMTFTRLRELLSLCKKMNINTELLPTEDAAATFNFCSLDRRFVAAALIPPKKINLAHDLQYISVMVPQSNKEKKIHAYNGSCGTAFYQWLLSLTDTTFQDAKHCFKFKMNFDGTYIGARRGEGDLEYQY